MKIPPKHPLEAKRLESLNTADLLDTPAEAKFDNFTYLASEICQTSISVISLVDSERQWFKSKVGLDAYETSRDISFCGHAILQNDIFEIPDALEDERFSTNPLVTGDPKIRFYAGIPILLEDELPIGTLCVIDTNAKKLSEQQREYLTLLSEHVADVIKLRKKMSHLEQQKKLLEEESLRIKQTQKNIIDFIKKVKKENEIF